ncbi:hypothetical protein [Halomarina oriensis]|uniref:Uncharacterized protein n=1 Tax=Halomarina oriensis TaxID=671145 RepID=A0A6B0GQY5_9EURY|nr:hypothetical protein [Halomarina oriensis]MWG35073.1 hypothetical protein [Halomarina oriensis]
MNDEDGSSRLPRRRLLTGVAAVGTTALAGCVTTGLSVSAPEVDESPVFDSFSIGSGVVWGSDAARVSATLTEQATTTRKVRELSAITASGSDAWTGTVAGGQTSVTMHLPVGTDLTVHAFDSSAEPVDAQPLRITGDRFP